MGGMTPRMVQELSRAFAMVKIGVSEMAAPRKSAEFGSVSASAALVGGQRKTG
jgi:hypothetical protein